MPTEDLTPEEWEDLIATDHSCDERCLTRHHTDHLEPAPDYDSLPTVLALFECGLPGRAGSVEPELLMHTLWGQSLEALGLRAERDMRSADLARVGAKYTELLEEWKFDMATRDVLRRAEEATAKAVQQEQRRQELARRRAMPRADRRAPNKPVRVDVDPEAWDVVKRRALQDGRKVAEAIGELVTQPPGPFPVHPGARPQRRFARLFIRHLDWVILRVIAAQESVTVTRLIGVIVEHEAKRLGWKRAVER